MLILRSILQYRTVYKFLRISKDERKLKPSISVAHIIVSISIAKFNLRTSSMSPDSSSQVEPINIFNASFNERVGCLQNAQRRVFPERPNNNTNILKQQSKKKIGTCKILLLLATFVRGIPARSKELRTMRLYVEKEKNDLFDYVKTNSGNFIVFQEDERVIIVYFMLLSF